MIDVHSHLYFPDYDADREEAIERAFAGGMTHMLSVGTEPEDWDQALSITEHDARIRAAIGVHPHWFNHEARSTEYEVRGASGEVAIQQVIQRLREYIGENRERVVAIGECGLDYFSRSETPISDEQKVFQKEGFMAQASLAQEFGLPLIIHTRPSVGSMDAYEDIFSLLHTSDFVPPIILHCYVGNTDVTEKFLTLPQVYFSFTGTITYPVKKDLQGGAGDPREVIRMIPLERILTETDCPFLAPQSHRGQRNEPSFVAETLALIAMAQDCPLEKVEQRIEQTVRQVFPTW